jgi:hypothetical protein
MHIEKIKRGISQGKTPPVIGIIPQMLILQAEIYQLETLTFVAFRIIWKIRNINWRQG